MADGTRAAHEAKKSEEALRTLKEGNENHTKEILEIKNSLKDLRDIKELIAAMSTKYDKMAELFQLRQLATVKIYKRRFEECASTINDLSEEFLVRCFTNGLKEEIKIGVQVYNPSTMDQAKGLALLREMTLEALEKRSKNSVSSGEKEKESTEVTCSPTVRSIVKESETLAGIDNSEENDGLMSWAKRQIQENCSSLVVVKDSRIKVGGMGLQEPGIKNEDAEEDLQLGSGKGTMVKLGKSVGDKECQEVEIGNGFASEELQSKSGQATKLELGDLARNKDNLESDLVLENHSDLVSTRDHSPFRRRHSKQKLATGKTWLHPLKLKISKHNVRQWKVHIAGSMVLYIFQIRVREPINIRFTSDSFILYHVRWIYKATSTRIWDPGGIALEINLVLFNSSDSFCFLTILLIQPDGTFQTIGVLIFFVEDWHVQFGHPLYSPMFFKSFYKYVELGILNSAYKVFDEFTDSCLPIHIVMVVAYAKSGDSLELRKTKLVCIIGPTCCSLKDSQRLVFERMIVSGFSHVSLLKKKLGAQVSVQPGLIILRLQQRTLNSSLEDKAVLQVEGNVMSRIE